MVLRFLHQRVGQVAQSGLFARTFARQPCVRIGSGLMGRVGPALTAEVSVGIARTSGGSPGIDHCRG